MVSRFKPLSRPSYQHKGSANPLRMKGFMVTAAATLLGACGMGGGGPAPGFSPPALPPLGTSDSGKAQPADGAIFRASHGYAGLHQGMRARTAGDLVTILLTENVSSVKSVSGQTNRSGTASITPPSAGLLKFLNPNALNASAAGSFNGTGNAAQQSTLNGTITVTIAEVRPNGTALVLGEKHMALSQGDEWVQFAGTIRLADITVDNQLASSQVASARIIYSGQGAMQTASRPGWLSRFFGKISPF
jgi:flagellar L-ring protein precursor FlgH